MDESVQQIVALVVVACVVAISLWRKLRARKNIAAGCSGCDSAENGNNAGEQPVRFYKRSN